VLDRRLAQLEREGVEFRLGVRVGVEPTWAALHADHAAVVIAIGAGVPRELAVPGRELAGVMLAMDYLEDANRAVAGLQPHARHDVAGQRVIVLGGGDTGSDCLGTALRQGAASVQQLELMPAPPTARRDDNPWPTWPLTFRTSSSQEEGGERGFALRTTALVGDGGRLTTLRAEKLAPAPAGPRWAPGDLIATGEVVELPCDRLILALGFTGPDTGALTAAARDRARRSRQHRRRRAPAHQRRAGLRLRRRAQGREPDRLGDRAGPRDRAPPRRRPARRCVGAARPRRRSAVRAALSRSQDARRPARRPDLERRRDVTARHARSRANAAISVASAAG
jgi:NADPH-dependent glutamate synthase beta subunit-like oxidoreductase